MVKKQYNFYHYFDTTPDGAIYHPTIKSLRTSAMDNPGFDSSPPPLYPTLYPSVPPSEQDTKKANSSNGAAGSIPTSAVSANGDANGGAPPQDYRSPAKKPGKFKPAYKKVTNKLQSNRVTSKFFPPSGEVATFLTIALTVISVFLMARAVLGPIAAPGGTIFALLVLIVLALLGGLVVKLIGMMIGRLLGIDLSLPPLLGMLLVGICLKNVPYNFGQFGRTECLGDRATDFGDSLNDISDFNSSEFDEHVYGFKVELNKSPHLNISGHSIDQHLEDTHNQTLARLRRSVSAGHDDHHDDNKTEEFHDPCKKRYIGHELDPLISRTLRSICLTVILLMAGLELDPVALWNLSAMVIRATFIPCFVEATAVAVLSVLLLGFTWPIGFMLGFVLAAVSPAVIIPSLMNLSERGYGVAKGIPTLVIAACSADDVVAISGFGIFLGITFKENASVTTLVLHGPIEVCIGLAFGIAWGILAQWIPNRNHKNVAFFRFLILFMGGLIALFGAHQIHYDGAGGLAAIIMAFVAGMRWRKEGWGDHNPVTNTFRKMWIILEPVIFALIGTEIQVDKIEWSTLGMGVLVLILALVLRMIGTYFAVSCGNLNSKEKIFMAFAWLPKATVQAALGPIFLDNVLKNNLNGDVVNPETGQSILTLAVLSILITAPLGAIAILALGPLLLTNDDAPKELDEVDAEQQQQQ